MSENGWHTICQDSDLEDGGMLPFELGNFQIALYKVNGEIYATDNICTHGMALLTDGFLDDDVVECPLQLAACSTSRPGRRCANRRNAT